MAEFKVIFGDITDANVDAIVNAAKPSLTGGSGVDGAIHEAAGSDVLKECLALKDFKGIRCFTGNAVITGAGQLKCKYIIHTVGPIYKKSKSPADLLRMSYISSIELALQHGCASIAFPAISCGKYGYSYDEAVYIAVSALSPYLEKNIEIYFYIFEKGLYEVYIDKINNKFF